MQEKRQKLVHNIVQNNVFYTKF